MFAQLISFAVVGGFGFVVDATAFGVGHYLLGAEVMPSRVCAFVIAATATWLGNRYFTFACQGSQQQCKRSQWCKHMLCAVFSALPNLVVFRTILLLFPDERFTLHIAFVLGVAAGMVSNFILGRLWVFRDRVVG